MITARQIPNGLGYYLSDLSKRINSSGTPLLENYQVEINKESFFVYSIFRNFSSSG
jgi:hypothetical protein